MSVVDVVEGREALARWEAERPRNAYDASPHLAALLEGLGLDERLRALGDVVATVVDPHVYAYEVEGPRAAAADSLGREPQAVRFHPAYHDAGRAIWASGIVGAGAEAQAAMLYLLTYAGENGHTCPVVCTAGAVRALRGHGSEELRHRFLPKLLETDYDSAERGAQFLTEVQGGSDVGANSVMALIEDGEWRLHGEKWFCSVADADQFVVTARPQGAEPGTRGLACFLVPRTLDGEPNGFRLRRLKDKLGTRALATGEIEFDGAVAYPIGEIEDGFKIAVGVVLNTSRWLNALGCAGLMRRVYLEALGFSRHRTAFGKRLVEFPLVRENLAVMKAEEHAALASSLVLTRLIARMDEGNAGASEVAFHRFLVNANKFSTSLAATRVARRGIEALGGNGTVEDFSPLPRLYRDAIVLESWEGTHNVLCAQVLRDLDRLDTLDVVLAQLRTLPHAERVEEALEALEPRVRRSLEDPSEHGALHFRRQLEALVRTVQVASLEDEAVAALVARRALGPGYDPESDPGYAGLIERVLAGDADRT